jgi:hypothetical protein
MDFIMEILAGKKTYIAVALMLAYAIGGMGLGFVEYGDGLHLILVLSAIVVLRLGLAKAE